MEDDRLIIESLTHADWMLLMAKISFGGSLLEVARRQKETCAAHSGLDENVRSRPAGLSVARGLIWLVGLHEG